MSSFQILIDADGCPVTAIAVEEARKRGLPCLLFCDSAHEFNLEGARTITVSKGADSADFALVNRAGPGDIVITQDYGLAAMCLAKRAIPLNQDGMVYTEQNIDGLLLQRHTAKKIRNAGGRLKGPKKRLPSQNNTFKAAFIRLLEEMSIL